MGRLRIGKNLTLAVWLAFLFTRPFDAFSSPLQRPIKRGSMDAKQADDLSYTANRIEASDSHHVAGAEMLKQAAKLAPVAFHATDHFFEDPGAAGLA